MTILLDTNLLVAALDQRDSRHKEAHRIVCAALGGQWGAPLVTDYVVDEALTPHDVQGRKAGSG